MMMDHEKPQAVFPTIFEFPCQQGQGSLDDQPGKYNGIIPDIEVTSTFVEEPEESTPPGAVVENLR